MQFFRYRSKMYLGELGAFCLTWHRPDSEKEQHQPRLLWDARAHAHAALLSLHECAGADGTGAAAARR